MATDTDTPTLPDEIRDRIRDRASEVDRLEAELDEARDAYYEAIASATLEHPQYVVADAIGVSRQRVSELAKRARV